MLPHLQGVEPFDRWVRGESADLKHTFFNLHHLQSIDPAPASGEYGSTCTSSCRTSAYVDLYSCPAAVPMVGPEPGYVSIDWALVAASTVHLVPASAAAATSSDRDVNDCAALAPASTGGLSAQSMGPARQRTLPVPSVGTLSKLEESVPASTSADITELPFLAMSTITGVVAEVTSVRSDLSVDTPIDITGRQDAKMSMRAFYTQRFRSAQRQQSAGAAGGASTDMQSVHPHGGPRGVDRVAQWSTVLDDVTSDQPLYQGLVVRTNPKDVFRYSRRQVGWTGLRLLLSRM